MSITHYIKEIGRGKDGARGLTQPQAHDLMCQVLDGKVTDLELGAFAIAMRIKGETTSELSGFLCATHERCLPLTATRPSVVLPSYNGARKLPNFTALLAMLLAQQGVQVLIHGPTLEPGRTSTAEIFQALGISLAMSAADVDAAWRRHEPAFMPTHILCEPLARLLHIRRVVGLRNSGHTVAKLLAPWGTATSLRVVNHTHPEYAHLLNEFLAHTEANALLLRGTEGEPVADPRRTPQFHIYIAGHARTDLSQPAQTGVLTELPVLPQGIDAFTTAQHIQGVLASQHPAPAPVLQQAHCLVQALKTMQESSSLSNSHGHSAPRQTQ